MQETNRLLQRMMESLAFDIKAISGEQHRCGIWSKHSDQQEETLLLICASFGFPKHYTGIRRLNINHSIAGRCFRKQESLNVEDVTKDSDWQVNTQSKSPYKALICVPLGFWGVLTIDAINKLSSNCLLIAELYASIIDGVMIEFYKNTSFLETEQDQNEVG